MNLKEEIKSWRNEQYKNNKPCSYLDFYRNFKICFQCKSEGKIFLSELFALTDCGYCKGSGEWIEWHEKQYENSIRNLI